MANVNLPRPDFKDLDGVSSMKNYLEQLLEEAEYILNNLDEDNMTDKYNENHKRN